MRAPFETHKLCRAPVCPDPNDPKVHYFDNSNEDPSPCFSSLFVCEENQTLFSDAYACGCGCIDP